MKKKIENVYMWDLKEDKGTEYVIVWKLKELIKSKLASLCKTFASNIKSFKQKIEIKLKNTPLAVEKINNTTKL